MITQKYRKNYKDALKDFHQMDFGEHLTLNLKKNKVKKKRKKRQIWIEIGKIQTSF